MPILGFWDPVDPIAGRGREAGKCMKMAQRSVGQSVGRI